MSQKLTWLHISDIHFHPNTEWRDSESRSALLGHLRKLFDEDGLSRPDLIFCTGDIAFGESSNAPLCGQYEQAKEFFNDLLAVCAKGDVLLPKERLFVVPGNHDVNRRSINLDAQTTLTTWAKDANKHAGTINQRVEDCSKEFRDTITRLDEYANFVREFLPHQHDPHGRHHFTSICECNGRKIGIAGFNSAWTCSGPEDDRNIWLAADWQFNNAKHHLKDVDVRFGLMHHPVDWLNSADRELATRRISSDYHFWLHGHSHNSWVTPIQTHIVIGAGAIGAKDSEEFGINLTSIDFGTCTGVAHLHSKKAGSGGWTIAPIANQAPKGLWSFDLPIGLRGGVGEIPKGAPQERQPESAKEDRDFVGRYLTNRFENSLRSFSSQPNVWVAPILSRKSEIAQDAKSEPPVDLASFIANPTSTMIKAPPQYGQTCLAHHFIREAWRTKSLWLYLDAKSLKPHLASINEGISNELKILGCSERDLKCVVLDSWSENEKDALKLLRNVCSRFPSLPIVCMQHVDVGRFKHVDSAEFDGKFDTLYLWSLSRKEIRQIVAAYNEAKNVGDENAITARLVSDLEVLNLHRTPLNCLTLLKVSEIDFDESPVNRSEMIKRVLFLLFNVDEIPTYKSRPDLKDCEYVLGYFCEILIRDGVYGFTRDKFLLETHKCSQERLIDLETHVVFDVLFENNILIKRGSFFYFKFSYWIFYFAAQRMHHHQVFADYIFEDMRYAQHPELIEFYTGIDRRREDALEILIRDVRACTEDIKSRCGLPEGLNPYEFAAWKPSPETEAQMHQAIADGVEESNLPDTIKDQYADRTYDPKRPYDQNVTCLLTEYSFASMMQTMKAGARALRNSDYVSPEVKRRLLAEILGCWEQVSKVLFIVLPVLAEKGRALYDGAGFVLAGDFGDTLHERSMRILCEIPYNVVTWSEHDLYSRKMGPLLIDQLNNRELSPISKHELVLLLIRQRPRDWSKHVHHYIVDNKKNSFYLMDVYKNLRSQYQYSFASPQTLRDIEGLVKLAAAKHVTGEKDPSEKTIRKVRFSDDVIPPRNVE